MGKEWKARIRGLLLGRQGGNCLHRCSSHPIGKSFRTRPNRARRETGKFSEPSWRAAPQPQFHYFGKREETDFNKQIPVSGQKVRWNDPESGPWWHHEAALYTDYIDISFSWKKNQGLCCEATFILKGFFSPSLQPNIILNGTNDQILPLNIGTFWFMSTKYILVS